ncbi:putative hydrolase YxeP [Spirochaetia bacterium]|nr:putative hydrolase YxeP [Spirochaetia bacterium]
MDKETLQQTLEGHFKWFHRHPEPSNGERETTTQIRRILDEAGIEVLDVNLKTGLVARIQGTKNKPETGIERVIALRADIDALPVTEESGLEYASENAGVMHACGHDFHLSALLGAALLLREQREDLPGTVKLLFQPAEEGGGGARQVLASGVLQDVNEIYGLHVAADLPPGLIAVSPGATHAAVGSFKIIILGKGGHGAYPQQSRDPVPVAAQIVNAAQTIVSRNTSPFEHSVLSFTHVEAGNTWNVIPETALLEGTFRAFSDEKLAWIAHRLEQVSRGIAVACEVEIDFSWEMCTSATCNDPALTDFVIETAKARGLETAPSVPGMGGEDFAYYQKTIPGVFWTIGVGSPQGHHHPGFIADPAPLSTAAELLAALAIAGLQRLSCN